MYCKEDQQGEEDMYNNEHGSPSFEEFLNLIGKRVRLRGFNKYKAGLCNKSKYHTKMWIRIDELHGSFLSYLKYLIMPLCIIKPYNV